MRLTKNNNSSVLSACAFSILIHLVVIPALKAALNAKICVVESMFMVRIFFIHEKSLHAEEDLS